MRLLLLPARSFAFLGRTSCERAREREQAKRVERAREARREAREAREARGGEGGERRCERAGLEGERARE